MDLENDMQLYWKGDEINGWWWRLLFYLLQALALRISQEELGVEGAVLENGLLFQILLGLFELIVKIVSYIFHYDFLGIFRVLVGRGIELILGPSAFYVLFTMVTFWNIFIHFLIHFGFD